MIFIKQGVTSYGPIEDSIHRAARNIPDLDFKIISLTTIYFSQPAPLNEESYAVRMHQAIHNLLQPLIQHESENILLLNGFVLDHYYPEFFDKLRAANKKIISWQIDDPYYIDKTIPFVKKLDLVLTVDTATMPTYKSYNKNAVFLPLACDPLQHRSYPDLPAEFLSDICFIGVPFTDSRRVELIDNIIPTLSAHNSKIMGTSDIDTWQKNLRHYQEGKDFITDVRTKPEDTVKFFAGAKINLNIHKDSFGHAWDKNSKHIVAQSPCERTFCIAGCGGFQLIDDTRPDLSKVFTDGEELVTFSDEKDLASKINYYLKHEEEMTSIALAGQQRAHSTHTYQHRLSEILNLL
jgi:spore maturation protein CgeB